LHPDTFCHTCKLKSVQIAGSNPNFCLDADGNLYDSTRATLLFVPRNWNNGGTFKLTETVTRIGRYALENCCNVTAFEFPNPSKVTLIAHGTLAFTCLVRFQLPVSVTTLGDGFLQGNELLTSITFDRGVTIDQIPSYAFAQTAIETITIPGSVKIFLTSRERQRPTQE
jgi:hypothetical protein